MKFRLSSVSKSKMYRLLSDTLGNLPKMKYTEFKSFRGRTFWMCYRETSLEHIMNITLDCYAGSVYLLVQDRTNKTTGTIYLSVENMEDRGMIEII